jgi:hypothetical protein
MQEELVPLDNPGEEIPVTYIEVHGRKEHEELLRDAEKMHSLNLDPVYEKMVYLTRWGNWLNGCCNLSGENDEPH